MCNPLVRRESSVSEVCNNFTIKVLTLVEWSFILCMSFLTHLTPKKKKTVQSCLREFSGLINYILFRLFISGFEQLYTRAKMVPQVDFVLEIQSFQLNISLL